MKNTKTAVLLGLAAAALVGAYKARSEENGAAASSALPDPGPRPVSVDSLDLDAADE